MNILELFFRVLLLYITFAITLFCLSVTSFSVPLSERSKFNFSFYRFLKLIQLKGVLSIFLSICLSNRKDSCLSIHISVSPIKGGPVIFILYHQILIVKMAESFEEKSVHIFLDFCFIFFLIISFFY